MPTSFVNSGFENEGVSVLASAPSLRHVLSQADCRSLTPKLEQFLAGRPETPFLALDLEQVRNKYLELQGEFPQAAIHYAVKANPAPEIIQLLATLGSRFDVASRYELDLCLSLGVPATWLSYGNTVKKEVDIAYAFDCGVRLFAFDSEAELEKLGRQAPGAGVQCRVLSQGKNADWPLSRKFGCDLAMAYDLLLSSRDLGLNPLGVTFHVGSQQTDPQQWVEPMQQAAELYSQLRRQDLELEWINIGGGLPATYQTTLRPFSHYAQTIQQALQQSFGVTPPQLMIEPGRFLVADAGVIQSEVILVAHKSREDVRRWVYLDIGKFGGLAETMDECIKYRLRTLREGPTGPVILAGPTCDSADVLYEKTSYELPLDLAIGDRIEVLSAGAYTSSYASVGFNGFPPLRTYCL
ncbi:type III PLP-dependent enzyme [uncultured Nitrospira sp.]|uniref:type III PLP-dependent enzyme n=1 Tax=uncultured Nitrospira sp. TaxID=157176 RepID=UPI003140C092